MPTKVAPKVLPSREHQYLAAAPDAPLTVEVAAAGIRLTTDQLVRRRYAGGSPKYVKSGGRVFYLKRDCEDWLAKHPEQKSGGR